MFQVVWLQTALDELAATWLRADSTLRQAITSATHAVDHLLQLEPHDQGESRANDQRILFQPPLGVTFEVHQEAGVVLVLDRPIAWALIALDRNTYDFDGGSPHRIELHPNCEIAKEASMTEADWLACTDPMPMLWSLRDKASDRKLRLAACGYCRSVWRFMGKASRKAVLLGEQMADEPVDESLRKAVARAAIEAVCRLEEAGDDFFMAADMAYRVPSNDGWYAVEWTIGNRPPLASGVPIVRDIFGDPFRPVIIEPGWLTRNLINLACTLYDDSAFYDLPILADALEEGGCTDPDILNHCRQPGEHVRGCWILDLLLGKK